MKAFPFISFCLAAALGHIASSAVAGTIVVSVQSNDITFDPATGLLYVSVPSGAATNPNTIVPINPLNGATGTAIAVQNNPTRVVSSGDGSVLYVVSNNNQTVQRYLPASGTFATKLSILADNVSQISAVPGYSDLVAISQNNPGVSPPAVQTAIYQNGSALPNHIGNGVGVGGPDIIGVNDTGTLLYGYQTSVSSYTNWTAAITPGPSGGLTSTSAPTLQNVLTNFNVGQIQIADNMLFDSRGNIFDVLNPSLLAQFPTDGTITLDPLNHRFYSMVTSGPNQTLDVFDMDVTNSVDLLGTIPISGGIGNVGEITRFGSDGLALRTSTQVVLLNSSLVPEPSSLTLLVIGGLAICGVAAARMKSPTANPWKATPKGAEVP